MASAETIARLKSLLDDWHEVSKACLALGAAGERFKARFLEYCEGEAKGAAPNSPIDFKAPLPDSVGAALGPKVGLTGPIGAATGQKLMELLVKVYNGNVDDTVRAALTKHCQVRFSAESLQALSEVQGLQLVKDFQGVLDGKHELAYNEEGALIFSNWQG